MTKLTILAMAAALSAGSALAQAPDGSNSNSSNMGASAGTAAQANAGSKVDRGDTRLMTDLIEANIAEIDTAKLALEKSQNAEVKAFAQHMIDDHGAALKELQALAQSKGMKVPDNTDLPHRAMATALKALKGDAFDNQYLKRVGVGEHERTLKLLQKVQKEAKDADMKAMAAKMLPTVRQHLETAQKQAQATTAKK